MHCGLFFSVSAHLKSEPGVFARLFLYVREALFVAPVNSFSRRFEKIKSRKAACLGFGDPLKNHRGGCRKRRASCKQSWRGGAYHGAAQAVLQPAGCHCLGREPPELPGLRAESPVLRAFLRASMIFLTPDTPLLPFLLRLGCLPHGGCRAGTTRLWL